MFKKYAETVLFFVVVCGVLLSLFWPSFIGYPLQGIDGSIGLLKAIQEGVPSSLGQWHPFYWMGQASMDFYPSLYYFALRFLPAMWLQNIYYPLLIFFALLGMMLWLRQMGRSFLAALFGAVSYGLMPHWVSLVFGGHLLVFEALAWLPYLFMTLMKTFRETSWRWIFWAIVSGILWGTLLNADVQRGFYLSLVAATMVVGIWYETSGGKFWRKLPINLGKSLLVSVFLLGVMSITLQGWLATLEMRKALQGNESSAMSGWEFATQFSQDPRELIDSLAFGYHGKLSGDKEAPYWGTKEFNGNSDSLGFFLVVFGLAGFIFLFRKDASREEKRWLVFWGVWAILGLFLAFGKHWPGKPLYWLFYQLPVMSQFRVPLKWLIVFGVSLVVVGSYALDRFLGWAREKNKAQWTKLLYVTSSLVGIATLWYFYHLITADALYQRLYPSFKGYASLAVENRGEAILRMTGLFLLVLAVVTSMWVSFSSRLKEKEKQLLHKIAIGLLFGGMLIDLLSVNGFYFDKAFVKEGKEFYRKDELISQLHTFNGPFRIAPSLLFNQNNRLYPVPTTTIRQAYLTYDFPYHGIEAFDVPAESGVDTSLQRFMLAGWSASGVTNITTLDDVLKANLPIFQLANVQYVILDGIITNTNYPLVGIWKDKIGQPHAVYQVKGALPRLSWFSRSVSVKNETEAFEILSRPAWTRTAAVIVENGSNLQGTDQKASIGIRTYTPVRVEAEVNAPTDGYLLFATRYHSQWHARVNGEKTPILKANVAQMAIFVPQGTNSVVFSYEPSSFTAIVSWLSFALGLLIFVVGVLFRKNSGVNHES